MKTFAEYYAIFRADGHSDFDARLLAADAIEFDERDEWPLPGGSNDSFPIGL